MLNDLRDAFCFAFGSPGPRGSDVSNQREGPYSQRSMFAATCWSSGSLRLHADGRSNHSFQPYGLVLRADYNARLACAERHELPRLDYTEVTALIALTPEAATNVAHEDLATEPY